MTSHLRQKPSLQQKNSLENFDRRFQKTLIAGSENIALRVAVIGGEIVISG
jgi:hypothetical protein